MANTNQHKKHIQYTISNKKIYNIQFQMQWNIKFKQIDSQTLRKVPTHTNI